MIYMVLSWELVISNLDYLSDSDSSNLCSVYASAKSYSGAKLTKLSKYSIRVLYGMT